LALGVGFGTAAASATIALVLSVAANLSSREAKDLRQETGLEAGSSACYQPSAARVDRCAELQDELERKDALHNSAVAFWVLTGAALVGTSIYVTVVALSDDEESEVARITPLIGPTNVGLGVMGAF